jgi:hypothetical protein
MKLTNKFSLPEPFVAAVSSDDYQRGDAEFTSTELIKPSRILVYSRRHEADMVEDVSDRVWAFQGQTKHMVLERIARTNPDRYLVEQRFESVVPGYHTNTGVNCKISGQIDLFDKGDGTLYDWKETSVWRFMLHGDQLDNKDEWVQQANINLFLMRMNDFNVRRLVNIAILKDWKARKARFSREPDYPKCAVHVIPLPMWSIGEAQAYLLERINKHRAEAASPPVCTKEERWQRDAAFAVMRTDRKRAVKLCMSRDQAEAVMMHHMKIAPPGDAKKYYIEQRNAEPVRCLDFCSVQPFCDFGVQAELKWEEKHKLDDSK